MTRFFLCKINKTSKKGNAHYISYRYSYQYIKTYNTGIDYFDYSNQIIYDTPIYFLYISVTCNCM